ncbi:MAG TPA: polysaccharide export protein EpsE [Methylophilaceae bacterium]|nr:polysaccharide export protein EpsE [Methylophilaceae bacterium]
MQHYRFLNAGLAALLSVAATHSYAENQKVAVADQAAQIQPADPTMSTPDADNPKNYTLGPGDEIRISVFQNPDLSLDTRVNENGNITYPLIGEVDVGGKPIASAEKAIASALKSGGFVQQPQVNILLMRIRGNQVSVLGEVNRPGRYPIETFNTHVSEMLANAGGIVSDAGPNAGGAEKVILVGYRNGERIRKEIDVHEMFMKDGTSEDMTVAAGDILYVPPAPLYYIYGETQKPGSFRIRNGMSIQQALAEAGGPTIRGTERGIKVYRKNDDGKVEPLSANPNDPVQPGDVIYVSESLF